MPITTFQTIQSTDKLQSGFRAKFNANVALLITDITDNGDGTATVELQGGTNFQIDLGISFYTKDEVVSLITAVQAAVWGAITGDVSDQTDVVGNFGVIDDIDNILISCNFAVAAGDSDNPFGAFPASGYSSFSIPGIAGTGWQILTKEAASPEIKFRVYYSGAWQDWINVIGSSGPILIPAGSNPTTLVNGVDFTAPSLIPFVLQTAKPVYPTPSTTKLTTEGQSLRTDYQYTDNTLSELVSIDVWVADNTVDTWVRVI